MYSIFKREGSSKMKKAEQADHTNGAKSYVVSPLHLT